MITSAVHFNTVKFEFAYVLFLLLGPSDEKTWGRKSHDTDSSSTQLLTCGCFLHYARQYTVWFTLEYESYIWTHVQYSATFSFGLRKDFVGKILLFFWRFVVTAIWYHVSPVAKCTSIYIHIYICANCAYTEIYYRLLQDYYQFLIQALHSCQLFL